MSAAYRSVTPDYTQVSVPVSESCRPTERTSQLPTRGADSQPPLGLLARGSRPRFGHELPYRFCGTPLPIRAANAVLQSPCVFWVPAIRENVAYRALDVGSCPSVSWDPYPSTLRADVVEVHLLLSGLTGTSDPASAAARTSAAQCGGEDDRYQDGSEQRCAGRNERVGVLVDFYCCERP